MAASLLLRALRRRELASPLGSLGASLQSTCAANICSNWGSSARPSSAKAAGNDVIGIDSGTTNSCDAVMKGKVMGYGPTSRLSRAQVLPRWFSSVASNGSLVQKSQISETYKSGGEMKQSDAQKSSDGATPKVMAFSPLEAAVAKPRSSPLTSESSKVRRSEIATQVTFYMIPALLLVSKNSISTSLLVGAVFHQIYMFHKEILLDYVHHDITRKWALIYLKLLLLVMAKDTIIYFNLF